MVFARTLLPPAALALALNSCSTAYYRALEQIGIEKREILVDRVEDARWRHSTGPSE